MAAHNIVDKAHADALIYGVGFIQMDKDFNLKHVPYAEAIEDYNMAVWYNQELDEVVLLYAGDEAYSEYVYLGKL